MLDKVTLSAFGTYTMVFCAVALTANTGYNAYKRSRRPPTAPWNIVSDWRSYAASGHRLGPMNAATTIVVFSDYQCPVCLRMDRQLRELRARHPATLRVIFREFPLPFHAQARDAAQAAECAAAQGFFPAYHERLFDQQDLLGKHPWVVIASAVGVPDTVAFSRCLRDPRVAAITDSDIAAGKTLGVFGTPTLLVDDEEYVGIPWDFDKIVERHLAVQRPPG